MTTTGDPPGSTLYAPGLGNYAASLLGCLGFLNKGLIWALGSGGGQLLLGRSRPVATQPLSWACAVATLTHLQDWIELSLSFTGL